MSQKPPLNYKISEKSQETENDEKIGAKSEYSLKQQNDSDDESGAEDGVAMVSMRDDMNTNS